MGTQQRNVRREILANAHRRAARAAIGERRPSGQGLPGPGSVNPYRCTICDGLTVTVHRDTGITPMTIACPALGCDGRAFSGMYRVPKDQLPVPTHEWYRPGVKQLASGVTAHVAAGGLLLRPVNA